LTFEQAGDWLKVQSPVCFLVMVGLFVSTVVTSLKGIASKGLRYTGTFVIKKKSRKNN